MEENEEEEEKDEYTYREEEEVGEEITCTYTCKRLYKPWTG